MKERVEQSRVNGSGVVLAESSILPVECCRFDGRRGLAARTMDRNGGEESGRKNTVGGAV